MAKKMKKSYYLLLFLTVFLITAVFLTNQGGQVFAASASITNVTQIDNLFLINDAGNLKSKTTLAINNPGSAFNAWIRITVAGKTAYLESIGSLANGTTNHTVHVLELTNNNDNVTFDVFDNSSGTGTPLYSTTRAQKKIRRWKIFVAHDSHCDVGYTDYQEYLKDTKWPGFMNDALGYIPGTDAWSYNDQFRYPVESSFELYDGAWNVKDADWIERIRTELQRGRMSYSSTFFNYVSEGMGTEETARANYYSLRYMKDLFGINPERMGYKRDDPGMSWGQIDAMVEAGIKYHLYANNADHNRWDMNTYPRMYYIQGRKPENKVLVWDGMVYASDELGFAGTSDQTTYNNVLNKLQTLDSSGWAYDSWITDFTWYGDNLGICPNVKDRVKGVNQMITAAGFTYPQIIYTTPGEFFEHIQANYSGIIPAYKGTRENYWNMGAASTSYEGAVNKRNHDKLPTAEFLAAMASASVANAAYPYEQITDAYKNMIIYDEHTWGPASSILDDQWLWKRNTAIAGDVAANRVMNGATGAINSLIPTSGNKTVVVYNPSSWARTDLVKANISGFPAHFDLLDVDTGSNIKYQRLDDGTLAFVAANIPGLGYKCFRANSRADEPTFSTSIITTANTIENNYYKVTFDASGSVSSILDKQNGNYEMVDNSAPYPMNQFVYYTTQGIGYFTPIYTTDNITQATLAVNNFGPVMGSVMANGTTRGAESISRKVILYDSIPRIDFVNDVLKSPAPPGNVDEEGYFVFPLRVNNFMLRHEMPTGDVRPHVDSNINNPANEQYYTSCTDHYTVNRWIDASDQNNYGITFSPVDAPLVEYGERRSCSYSWDYNTVKPWLYSYIFNNKWHTNFQRNEPGWVTFAYSLRSHTGATWQAGNAQKFGQEVTSPLQPSIVTGTQSGNTFSGAKGQFISTNKDNVVLTSAKIAEANGEGLVLRFNETLGQNTNVTVDLSWLNPTSAVVTDLVENDNLALTAQVSASSQYIDSTNYQYLGHYDAHHVIDGIAGVHDNGEWASKGEQNPWIRLDWPGSKTIDHVVLFDRPNAQDNAPGGTLTFSDGSYVDVTGMAGDGTAKTVSFSPKTVTWVKFQVSGGSGTNVGLSEFEVYGAPMTITSGTVNFDIDAYGWKTIRIKRGSAPAQVTGVGATMVADGTLVSWGAQSGVAYYEVFRNKGSATFTAGTGNYIGSSSAAQFFDKQVRTGVANPYFYKVRAVKAGLKGVVSSAVQAVGGTINDTSAPTVPQNLLAFRLQGSRVTLSWQASTDNKYVKGYKVYRGGAEIKDVDVTLNSFLDVNLNANLDYSYTVKAYDAAGNLSAASNTASVAHTKENNVAGGATVTSSTEFNGQFAKGKVIDGIAGEHESGEWASAGEKAGAWVQLTWSTSRVINKVVLYDRPNTQDQVTGGTLSFSDGSAIVVNSLDNYGAAMEINFLPKTVTWVKFTVGGVSTTTANVGLSEFEAYSPNIAPGATLTASSEYSSQYSKDKAVDGIIGSQTSGEWATAGQKAGAWIQLNWGSAKVMNKVCLSDRANASDQVTAGTLSFSDGSTVPVGSLDNAGAVKEVIFTPRTVSWVKFTVDSVSGSTLNIGLSEIQVFNTDINIADDDNASAVFTGTWTENNVAIDRFNYTEHYTNTTNSYYQFTFTGTEIRLVGTKEVNRGMSDVYIDGVFDRTVDQYSAIRYFQQEIYVKTGLASGTHTVKVVCKGQKNASASDYYVCVDAFRFR
jgi:hypothetical protein